MSLYEVYDDMNIKQNSLGFSVGMGEFIANKVTKKMVAAGLTGNYKNFRK